MSRMSTYIKPNLQRLEQERRQLRRDIARYRKLVRRYEQWLKEYVIGNHHDSS